MSINFSSDAASLKSEEKVGGIASPTAAGDFDRLGKQRGHNARARIDRSFTAGHSDNAERKPVEHLRDEPAAQGSLRAAIESRPERRAPIDHVRRAVWIMEYFFSSARRRLQVACQPRQAGFLHIESQARPSTLLELR